MAKIKKKSAFILPGSGFGVARLLAQYLFRNGRHAYMLLHSFSFIVSPSTATWSHSSLYPPGHLAAAEVFNTKKKRPVVWSLLIFPVWYRSEQTTSLEICSWILYDFHTLLRRYERRNPCRSTRRFHGCALRPGFQFMLFICGFIQRRCR